MATASNSFPLLAVLRDRNPGLADQAKRLIEEAHLYLPLTTSTFPSGTDHTPTHTMTVEMIARMLLSDEFLAALSDHELFFLAIACHYHDLGMVGTVSDDATAEGRGQVRNDHALRIGEIIKDKWKELGFEDARSAHVLAEICRGHRPNKNVLGERTWDDIDQLAVLAPGVSIRLRLICTFRQNLSLRRLAHKEA
jgi:hypothetical protein